MEYWHGLTFFIVIVIVIVLIMEIVNYCQITKMKSELCYLTQSECYDSSYCNYGGYRPYRFRAPGYCPPTPYLEKKFYYRRSCSRRRSSSRPNKN